MPQDLIGCRKRRKLKSLIPRVFVFVNDPSSVERRIDFAVFFIVLWSYGRKICLNICHGNSENSYGCSYLLRICFIYGKWVYRGVESLRTLLTANKVHCILIYQQTGANQNTVHLKTGFIWKFSREWLLNRIRRRRLIAKETSIANCEVLDEKYRIAVQEIFSVHRLVVCLRFL